MMTGVRRKDVVINIGMNSFNYTTPFSDVRVIALTRLFRTVLKSKATLYTKVNSVCVQFCPHTCNPYSVATTHMAPLV